VIHGSIYKTIFILFVFVQILFPSVELITILAFLISFAFLIEKRIHLPKSIFQVLFILGILIAIGVTIGALRFEEFYDYLRDIIHFSKPFLLILSGFLISRKMKDISFLPRALVYISLLFAIKHFIVLATSQYTAGTIAELRLVAGGGNFVEILGLFFLIIYYKKDILRITERTKAIFILIISISVVFYFSRTMLIALVVFLLSAYGYTLLSRKAFEYATFGLVVIGLIYGHLWTIDLDPDAKGVENFFYKIRNAPAEVFVTPGDYDTTSHKEIFDHWRGYEASMALQQMAENPVSYIVGNGFGSLVDLGFKAPIGGEDGLRYIPHFHNGYVYVFYKTGLIGILFYLIIIFNLYKRGYVRTKTEQARTMNRLISGFGIYFFVTTLVITGMYNLQEISVFLVGCFFALSFQFEQRKHQLVQ
jgi:hypothetical protein